MTEYHHGNATAVEDVFEGALAVKVTVHGETLVMSDREARDTLLCLADLFPSMLPVRVPARVGPVREIAPPPQVLEIPLKPCGCGVLLGEVCDCALVQADAEDVFGSALRWGWTK